LDQLVTLADIMHIRGHILGNAILTNYSLISADVNCDGNINEDDINLIRDIILGLQRSSAKMAIVLDSIINDIPLDANILSDRFLLATDWNGDGVLNSKDTLMIHDIIEETQEHTPQVESFLSKASSELARVS